MRTLGFLAAVLGFAAQDAPVLRCKTAPAKGRAMSIEGTAPSLPDGTDLRLFLFPARESLDAGKLVLSPQEPRARGVAKVDKGKFAAEIQVPAGPGAFHASVQSVVPPKKWDNLYVAGWDEELVKTLGPALREFDPLVDEGKKYVERVAAASATKRAWDAARKELEDALVKWMDKVESSEAKKVYPAAAGSLVNWVQDVGVASRKFKFPGEKLGAVEDVYGPHKDPDGKPYAPANYRKALERLPEVAGREFSLWIVKDRRRAGSLTPAAAEAVKGAASRAGVSAFARRLEGAAENLDALEKDLRALKP